MDGDRDRRVSDREPRGFVPRRAPDPPGRLRRALTWLVREREDIDQEGLLAGRTLRVGLRRPRRDDE